jgi:hypothetical protein
MNGVDWNHCDSADYSTSIWTNCYYLLLFCWGWDRVVHAVYVFVCFLAKGGVGKAGWRRYDNKNSGQHDFQINLGIGLVPMKYGISLEWMTPLRRGKISLGRQHLYPVTVTSVSFA